MWGEKVCLGLNEEEARLLCTRNEGGTCSLHEDDGCKFPAGLMQYVFFSFYSNLSVSLLCFFFSHNEAVEAEAGWLKPTT